MRSSSFERRYRGQIVGFSLYVRLDANTLVSVPLVELKNSSLSRAELTNRFFKELCECSHNSTGEITQFYIITQSQGLINSAKGTEASAIVYNIMDMAKRSSIL